MGCGNRGGGGQDNGGDEERRSAEHGWAVLGVYDGRQFAAVAVAGCRLHHDGGLTLFVPCPDS